jgi:hypothetical protein
MRYAKKLKLASVAGVFACSLLAATGASAAPGNDFSQAEPTGTVVGTVTCGPDNSQAPDAPVMVGVAGMDLTTQSDPDGNFVLLVPAAQMLSVQAVTGDADAIRPNVSVDQGQTLAIGTLDLNVCPQPAAVGSDTDQGSGPADNANSD